MGGMPPLGYDVKDRQLAVNPEEARTVVAIYQRYLARAGLFRHESISCAISVSLRNSG